MPTLSGIMKPLVTLMIPFSRNPSPDWCFSFASILGPMNGTLNLTKTVNVDRELARERLVDDALAHGSKYGLFLDDDVTVPPNIIRQMVFEFENADDDVMVIGGIYCTKTQPAFPLVYKDIGDGPYYKWNLGQVFECDLIATGMMMIKMEVFKYLSKPWFKEIRTIEDGKKYGLVPDDYQGRDFSANDDGFFCHKVKEAGFKILAHGGCLGIHLDDKGTAYVLPDNTYPIKCAMNKKWSTPPKDQDEYVQRVMSIYREAYGYTDFVPEETDLQKVALGA